MHLVMIVVALTFCWYLRCRYIQSQKNWAVRWQYALQLFLFPPLLLIATAIAILCMGTQGNMIGVWDGWLAYALAKLAEGIALSFCCWVIIKLLILTFEAFRLLQAVRTYPIVELEGLSARLLNTDDIFIAQVGFLHPELVASQGLLSLLDKPYLDAVLLHEQAHNYYRDTFWFFWLGWLRNCTSWLPNTNILYSELVALRELRADRWATSHVDCLLLAESLLQVVSNSCVLSTKLCISFNEISSSSFFVERVEALLAEPQDSSLPSWYYLWITLGFAFLPLIIVPFHG